MRNGEWRRHKKRDQADFLLCRMNKMEHQRMCIIFSLTLPPLGILSFTYPLLWFVFSCSLVAALVGLVGWLALEEEDQNVRVVDDNGQILFSGFGTEKEIESAMVEIDRNRASAHAARAAAHSMAH